MNKNYFEIKRAGINTTFQDQGRGNLYHIGIPFSGAMDNRNFQISNKLVGNEVNFPIIEFAYQGPLLKYFGENINFAITGDVKFIIRKKNNDLFQNFLKKINKIEKIHVSNTIMENILLDNNIIDNQNRVCINNLHINTPQDILHDSHFHHLLIHQ